MSKPAVVNANRRVKSLNDLPKIFSYSKLSKNVLDHHFPKIAAPPPPGEPSNLLLPYDTTGNVVNSPKSPAGKPIILQIENGSQGSQSKKARSSPLRIEDIEHVAATGKISNDASQAAATARTSHVKPLKPAKPSTSNVSKKATANTATAATPKVPKKDSPNKTSRSSSLSNELIQRKKANDLYNKLRVKSLTKRNVLLRDTGRKVRNAAYGFWDKFIKGKDRGAIVTNRVARHKDRERLREKDVNHEKKRADNKEHNLKVYRHAIGIPKEIKKLESTRKRINNRLAELEIEKNDLRIFVANFEKELEKH